MEESKSQTRFSVSDFIAVLNQTLEFAYPTVEIEGEVSSFKVNQDKYVFFDLKDEGGSIGCFMTVWQLRVPIEDGMKVIISAQPKLTNWGKFSLNVRSVRPSGEGALKKSFDLLRIKLKNEGLFKVDRKRPLPAIPKHIAVISSTAAAGYADFIKILNDRWGGMKIDVANVQVQGFGSADQIIKAINYFNQQEKLAEVLIVVRGGGSADDLSTFNDEPLVRAIASSRIPIIVGVGHETDESLTDMAADVRAATPSNAAQILVPDKKELIKFAWGQVVSLLPRMLRIIDQQKNIINGILFKSVESVESSIDRQIMQTQSTKKLLSQIDPNTVLARGYAIVKGVIKKGSNIEIEMKKDILEAEVKNVIRK